MQAEAVAGTFTKGAGGLLGDIGIVIALGAMRGALMAESGAADWLRLPPQPLQIPALVQEKDGRLLSARVGNVHAVHYRLGPP